MESNTLIARIEERNGAEPWPCHVANCQRCLEIRLRQKGSFWHSPGKEILYFFIFIWAGIGFFVMLDGIAKFLNLLAAAYG